jgi:hypothetical protein
MDSRARPGCGVVARGAVGPPGLRLARESLTANALVPGASRGGALPPTTAPTYHFRFTSKLSPVGSVTAVAAACPNPRGYRIVR